MSLPGPPPSQLLHQILPPSLVLGQPTAFNMILLKVKVFSFCPLIEAYPLYGILDVRGGELQTRGEYKAFKL